MTTVSQFRVVFKEETIKGLRDFGTIWYDVNFFDAENIIKKYENRNSFEILTRTITKDSNSLKNAIKAKFNN
jgi:iron uptake system EfeUOB component EfeO/EfeM